MTEVAELSTRRDLRNEIVSGIEPGRGFVKLIDRFTTSVTFVQMRVGSSRETFGVLPSF